MMETECFVALRLYIVRYDYNIC